MNIRLVIACLYLVPVCIGVLFWADTSGHGDSVIYRRSILHLHETGVLPLGGMEWYHPGHFLMLWPVFALGKAFGAWSDPLHAISLVNFVSTGWAAHSAFRTWKLLRPGDDTLVPLSAAAALATMPAWLWQSQEGMSDIVGTALVVAVTCRLLRHDAEGEARTAVWTLTVFLATWAGLVRISSALFLPLWVALVLRAVLHNQDITWSCVARGIVFGGLLPMALLFGYVVVEHGVVAMRDIYFSVGIDNAQGWSRVEALPQTVRGWVGDLWRGMGLLGPLAVAGCVLLAVRHRSFLWHSLLLLPYLAGVANNHASTEFRYMVPVIGYLALGYAAVAGQLQMRFGAWTTRCFLGVLVILNLWHAYPVLNRLHVRQHFAEVAARKLMANAPPHSLLVGTGSPNFLTILARDSQGRSIEDRAFMGVKVTATNGGVDYWNHPWPRANALVTFHVAEGRRIFCSNEPGTEGWLTQLEALGWKKKVLEEIPFQALRGQYDRDLLIPPGQERTRPLAIYELLPPLPFRRVELRVEKTAEDGSPGLRFDVDAPGHAGRHYQILVPGKVGAERTDWVGDVDIPFSWADPLAQLSRAAGVTPLEGVRGFAGKLDDQGRAGAFLHHRYLEGIHHELMATVLVLDDRTRPGTACARSGMVALPRE